MRSRWLVGVCLLSLAACSDARIATRATDPPPVNRIYDDTARFVAGLAGRAGSPFADLQNEEAWQTYAGQMNQAWARALERRVKPVQRFQTGELAEPGGKFAFYPFSGPDVLYVQSFYPDAEVYVLAGLERPGAVPRPRDYEKARLSAQLAGVSRGSASLFDRSFFVTSEMRGQLVKGVLPVALLLMARLGNTIENARSVAVDPDGALVDLPADAAAGSRPDGVEIVFHRDGESKRRRLYYFRVNLGEGLDKDSSFLEFLKNQGKPDVFIKSASFLLHYQRFFALREYLLTHARRIVQDDTGIRYGKFLEEGWTVRIYGAYQRPLTPFQNRHQADLQEASDQPGAARALGFSMGYGTGRKRTVILVATPPASS